MTEMKKHIYDESNGLWYELIGDYYIVDTLGIDPEICHKCRAIWKKMQARRLGRG